MNIWLALGVVVALVLIAVVILAKRPRSAEDELRQPKPRSVRLEKAGSLNSSSLRGVLLSAKAERISGTLQLTAGGRSCSVYFLFGHLFHAASDTLTGEAALQACLSWPEMQYAFDPKGKLPTDETIERPIDQILS